MEITPVRNDVTAKLGDTRDIDSNLYGGKAALLNKLKYESLPIPMGYAISSYIYDEYLQHGYLSNNIVEDIKQMKAELGGQVSIRSSATLEDGDKTSMAGVFNSYVVRDDNEIEKAIKSIFDGIGSEAVTRYLSMNEIHPSDVKMGIIIQKLIEPDFSGVLYSGIVTIQVPPHH